MWIPDESWKKQGTKKVARHGPSELLVASCWRWDKHQRRLNAPWRQKSSASACEGCGKRAWNSRALDGARWKKRVMENCANMNVDIEVLERLLVRENREISLRYMLKYSRRGGSNIFQLFDTSEKRAQFVANRKRSLESQGMKATKQESWQNEWHDIECQGVTANPENAIATAKFAFIQGGRRLLGREGRQAKAEYRFREDGQENDEIPGRH